MFKTEPQEQLVLTNEIEEKYKGSINRTKSKSLNNQTQFVETNICFENRYNLGYNFNQFSHLRTILVLTLY